MKPAPASVIRRYAFEAGPVKDGTWRLLLRHKKVTP